MVALTGTLQRDGGHLHLAVADERGQTLGGHLDEGCVVRATASAAGWCWEGERTIIKLAGS